MSDPSNPTNPTDKAPTDPYKEQEFDAFLKEIGNANLPNWSILAEAIGVSRDTIWRWKQHPLAKQALGAALEENLRKMSEVGGSDWKMYREKLKMLGVKDKQTIEHENIDALLDELESEDTINDVAEEAAKQVVAANPPIQNQG